MDGDMMIVYLGKRICIYIISGIFLKESSQRTSTCLKVKIYDLPIIINSYIVSLPRILDLFLSKNNTDSKIASIDRF